MMIVLNICKNLCRSRLRHCGGSIVHLNNILNNRLVNKSECIKTGITERIVFSSYKSYSTEAQSEPTTLLPPLCDVPPVIWPSFFKTLVNAYLINIIIRNKFDSDFQEHEFITASKHALLVVSSALARQDYENLEELVTADTISTLKTKIATLTDQQRDLLNVQENDMYFSFNHDVNISYIQANDVERRFVEITVAHHYVRDLVNVKTEDVPLFGKLPAEPEKILVANYRFRREFVEGVDTPWIINMINYFSPQLLVTGMPIK